MKGWQFFTLLLVIVAHGRSEAKQFYFIGLFVCLTLSLIFPGWFNT
jgi:hypothetical protein